MCKVPFIKNFNGLRFLAASYVISFHYFNFPENLWLSTFFSHGHISVPFFFLLSGFVLFYSYSQYSFHTNKEIWVYIKNRFIRLAPIYYMAMALSVLLLVRNQVTEGYLSIQENVLYSFIHMTFMQALVPFEAIVNYWNLHSWSLSVEMFLYICSPFVIKKIQRVSAIKSLLLLIMFSLINYFIYFLKVSPNINIFGLSSLFAPLYLPTFISGVVLAKVYLEYSDKIAKVTSPLFIISSVLLIGSFVIKLDKEFYSSFNPFYHITFSTLILSSCHETGINKWLSSKTFFILGEASYAMYIFQAPIKTLTQQFLSKVIQYKLHTGYIYSFTIFISIALFSLLISLYIDPKLRRKLKVILF